MENAKSSQDVTPGISKTSLWAIIVILLIVIGLETTYIFTANKPPKEEETAADQLNQQPIEGDPLGMSNTANANQIVTQSPDKIPTLMPTSFQSQKNSNPTQNTTNVQSPKIILNKEYNFPTENSGGNSGDFQFTLKGYQFTNKILVNNVYNTVDNSKKILAVNIEIKNDTDESLEVSAKDYLRLSVNNSGWFAPDIHNDPLEIQSSSSTTTIVGFPLNRSDNNLRLQVGEKDGEEEVLDITAN